MVLSRNPNIFIEPLCFEPKVVKYDAQKHIEGFGSKHGHRLNFVIWPGIVRKDTEGILLKQTAVFRNDLNGNNEAHVKINIKEYKKWNLQQIMAWIVQLDNGKYIEISEKLRDGFMKFPISTGEKLTTLTIVDLHEEPFNIHEFPIRKDLAYDFKSLVVGNDNNSVNTSSSSNVEIIDENQLQDAESAIID